MSDIGVMPPLAPAARHSAPAPGVPAGVSIANSPSDTSSSLSPSSPGCPSARSPAAGALPPGRLPPAAQSSSKRSCIGCTASLTPAMRSTTATAGERAAAAALSVLAGVLRQPPLAAPPRTPVIARMPLCMCAISCAPPKPPAMSAGDMSSAAGERDTARAALARAASSNASAHRCCSCMRDIAALISE
eukprot:355906-Chlamydomonas_euryale.AAC.7